MLLLSWYSHFFNWCQGHLLTCPTKKYFHIDCPGCGFQRSLLALLKGDLASCIQFYPASLPMLALFLFTLLHLKYQFAAGGQIIKYLQLAIGIIIMVFYIYKIITLKAFN